MRTTPFHLSLPLLGLALILVACDESHPVSRIDPGTAVVTEGTVIELGMTFDDLSVALGAPTAVRDTGPAGSRVEFADRAIAGMLDADGVVVALDVYAGFGGATDDGLAVGANAAEVLRPPDRFDPFTETWHYLAEGVAVGVDDGVITWIRVLSPR